MIKVILLVIFVLNGISTVTAQKKIFLYEQGVSGDNEINKPFMSVYVPGDSINTGTAILLFPGGGYSWLDSTIQGYQVAEFLVKKGITAAVIFYRLPMKSQNKERWFVPLQDAQQAIKLVRQNASEWKIDTNKIGAWGASSGGHLASTAGTHFNISYIPNKEKINLRPNFMVLIYPLISMRNNLLHSGSKNNLIGKNADEALVKIFSNDEQVNALTPPAYLIHSSADSVVKANNSINFYQALYKNRIAAEMHIYSKGDHGFVFDWPMEQWVNPILQWLEKEGWYHPK